MRLSIWKTMLQSEVRNILRDRMTIIMIIWPLGMGMLIRVLLEREMVAGDAAGILAMMSALIAGFAYGAVAGFSLLDDRDDQVFLSIEISPFPLSAYIGFKVLFSFIMAFLAGVVLIVLTGAVPMTFGNMLLVSLSSALQVPFIAFVVNAFATNKVEGFVAMKATGFLLLFPVGGFFFLDAKEWIFAIAPAHWAAKAVQHSLLAPQIDAGLISMNLSLQGYAVIGILYNLLLGVVAYRFFMKRNPM